MGDGGKEEQKMRERRERKKKNRGKNGMMVKGKNFADLYMICYCMVQIIIYKNMTQQCHSSVVQQRVNMDETYIYFCIIY